MFPLILPLPVNVSPSTVVLNEKLFPDTVPVKLMPKPPKLLITMAFELFEDSLMAIV